MGNPQLSGKLTGGISIIPHYVLLEFLLHSHPRPITKEEFTLFVLKVQKHSEIPAYLKLLDLYRSLLNGYWNQFWDDIDGGVYTKLRRVADYAARFLTLPRYLKSANGQLSIADLNEAKRILAWYKQGHDSHIAFKSRKDWFSHYGSLNSSPNSLLASDYYRKVGEIEEAVTNYREAIRKGLAPLNDSAEDYRCRINGEAAIENWLINHLDRIEPGLVLVGRQYETSSAGRIDVLALDRKSNYVVVELKRDMASDVALGQILRYLGWVRLNLSEQKPVRGFIIGKDIDRHLGYAIEAHDMLPSLCNPLRYGDLGARLKIRRTAKDCRAWVEDVGVP